MDEIYVVTEHDCDDNDHEVVGLFRDTEVALDVAWSRHLAVTQGDDTDEYYEEHQGDLELDEEGDGFKLQLADSDREVRCVLVTVDSRTLL